MIIFNCVLSCFIKFKKFSFFKCNGKVMEEKNLQKQCIWWRVVPRGAFRIYQIFKIKHVVKVVNSSKLWTVFPKASILTCLTGFWIHLCLSVQFPRNVQQNGTYNHIFLWSISNETSDRSYQMEQSIQERTK